MKTNIKYQNVSALRYRDSGRPNFFATSTACLKVNASDMHMYKKLYIP